MLRHPSILALLTSLATLAVFPVAQAQTNEAKTTFVCSSGYDRQAQKYYPTTYAWTAKGKAPIIAWKFAWFDNPDITPAVRCQQVSEQFQEAYEKNDFKYITNGIKNGQPVVCTAKVDRGECSTVLFTLRRDDNAPEVAREISELLNGRGIRRPIQHSGSSSQARVYYQIDIDDFLLNAPVEK
jgi:hypothetical protein